MSEDFAGKVAFVMGGTTGIGRAAADLLASRGAAVTVFGAGRAADGTDADLDNPNGPVQAAASLNLAAYARNIAILETRHTHLAWTGQLCSYVPIVDADGYLALPRGVGLGVEIDDAFPRSQNEG